MVTTTGEIYSGLQHAGAVPLVQAADVAEGADQPLDVLVCVAHGDIRQDVADIAEFHLDVVFVPEDVVDLDSGETQP